MYLTKLKDLFPSCPMCLGTELEVDQDKPKLFRFSFCCEQCNARWLIEDNIRYLRYDIELVEVGNNPRNSDFFVVDEPKTEEFWNILADILDHLNIQFDSIEGR